MLFLHPLDLRSALALVNCTHKLDTVYVLSIFYDYYDFKVKRQKFLFGFSESNLSRVEFE